MEKPFTVSCRNPEWENPGVQGIHRLAPRANLVPAQRAGITQINKEESSFYHSLNGAYRFRYCEEDENPNFYLPETDDGAWDSLSVPSMWQYHGYGRASYTNTEYPFPFDPPYIRVPNPVGYYRRTFLADRAEKSVLRFEGVDNAYYVYLNGAFVGFSKGSRNRAEFDVTSVLREGENLLAVKVLTYSDASYLENQDMIMANGIFRDVALIQTGEVSLWDWRITNDLRAFTVHLELEGKTEGAEVSLSLNGKTVTAPAAEKMEMTVAPDEVHLWDPEDPYLYTMVLTLTRGGAREVHTKKVGLMHSRFEGAKLLVNNRPITIKGVNRHETSPDNGRAITRETIEKELRAIKANHLNAIRTSHYTNQPVFYELCSEIGLMVLDEVDLETHGCHVAPAEEWLSRQPAWKAAYLDRTERSLQQNKNETCVFMRSMGNECQDGENILDGLRRMLAFDPDHVAIHDQDETWEDLFVQKPLDFIKRTGYNNRAALESLVTRPGITMQIEYGHGMGNGPGYLDGTQALVYKHENFIGGFVWEFKNHSMRRVLPDGRVDYLYGGDFGERGHWSNFCMDGYFLSDGTPKYTWRELGAVFAPIWTDFDGERVVIRNTYDFHALEATVAEWKLTEDAALIGYGKCNLPALEPHETFALPIPWQVKEPKAGAVYCLNLMYFEKGSYIGKDQIRLPIRAEKKKYLPVPGSVSAKREGEDVVIGNEVFRAVLHQGVLLHYEVRGKTLLDAPLAFCLSRAATDNDGITGMADPGFHRRAGEWNRALLDTVSLSMNEVACTQDGNTVECRSVGKAAIREWRAGFDVTFTFRFYADGRFSLKVSGSPYGGLPAVLPRIGLKVKLAPEFTALRWLGRGERESYPDCKRSAHFDVYQTDVAHSYTVYDKPQESGNHEDTRWLRLSAPDRALTVIGQEDFAFTCRDIADECLARAKHRSDIVKDDAVTLHLDWRMRGLGSLSCGPEPEEEFELRPTPFTMTLFFGDGMEDGEATEIGRCNLE